MTTQIKTNLAELILERVPSRFAKDENDITKQSPSMIAWNNRKLSTSSQVWNEEAANDDAQTFATSEELNFDTVPAWTSGVDPSASNLLFNYTLEEECKMSKPTFSMNFNPNVQEFVPSFSKQTEVATHEQSKQKPIQVIPSYKMKEKTEMCKNWLMGKCSYGGQCAFAHGEHELVKKSHVKKQYRMNQCDKFVNSGYCPYGPRCQFAHTMTDFGDFESQRTPYQNLLNANSQLMKTRMELVEDPEVEKFNVVRPTQRRLAIFEQVCPTSTKKSQKAAFKKEFQVTQDNWRSWGKKPQGIKLLTTFERNQLAA